MTRFATVFAAAALAFSLATPALADGHMKHEKMKMAGNIMVSDVWARASAGMARAGAAFMVIMNKGDADTLIAAKADVSKKTELHTHIKEGEVMKMRKVEGGVPVPAKGKVELKPGSYHVMFMGLNEPLKMGAKFPVTLTFAKAGDVTVEVQVMKAGAMGAMDHSKMKMDHGNMKMK